MGEMKIAIAGIYPQRDGIVKELISRFPAIVDLKAALFAMDNAGPSLKSWVAL
jgi:hypothetical protein